MPLMASRIGAVARVVDERAAQIVPDLVIEPLARIAIGYEGFNPSGFYLLFQYNTITGAEHLTTDLFYGVPDVTDSSIPTVVGVEHDVATKRIIIQVVVTSFTRA